jgi:hypothetical protein
MIVIDVMDLELTGVFRLKAALLARRRQMFPIPATGHRKTH